MQQEVAELYWVADASARNYHEALHAPRGAGDDIGPMLFYRRQKQQPGLRGVAFFSTRLMASLTVAEDWRRRDGIECARRGECRVRAQAEMEARSSRMWAGKSLRRIGGAVISVGLLLVPFLAFPDIGKTKHNLTKQGITGVPSGDESAICVFCHAPMAVGQNVALPEWRHSMRAAPPFPIYDHIGRTGRDGDVFVGSSSLACLSCHDGSQAANILKNGYNHPFGVPYKGLVVDLGTKNGSGTGLPPVAPYSSAMSNFVEDFRPALQGVIDNRRVWWVPASGVGGLARRTKHDLPLYGHEVESGGGEVPYVECASCHDPHSENRAFLRVGSSGSRLCLTCHDK